MYILLLFHTGLNSNLIPFWHSFSSQVQVLGQDQGLTFEFNPLTLRSGFHSNFLCTLSMKAWIWLSAVRRCLSLWQKPLPKAGNESHGFLLVWRKWPVMCHCEKHHNSGCKSKMCFISHWQILLIAITRQWLVGAMLVKSVTSNIAFPGIQMVVWKIEETGSCNDKKNTAVLKRARAKAYAHHSPAQAVKLMRRAGIPEDEIPDQHQVKNQRYSLSKDNKLPVVPVECLDDLRSFLANPPEKMLVLEDHMILSQERIVIPFCLKDSVETNQTLQDSELTSFLMDFTFCCCKKGWYLDQWVLWAWGFRKHVVRACVFSRWYLLSAPRRMKMPRLLF